MKNYLLIPTVFVVFICCFTIKTNGQVGGDNTYEFLNLTNSARIASIGDKYLIAKDNDITLTLNNPSVITPEMNNFLSLSFVDYFTDINYGFAMYSHTFNKIGSFVGAMQFIDYGSFTYADETGQTAGTFGASEYALNIGWGRSLDSSFSIGATLKGIFSSLETYTSYGIAVDVAGTYAPPRSNFAVSLIFRNIGTQIQSYYSGHPEPLPFEINIGMSKKLKHVPFRYFINYNHIEKWDLTYVDPNDPGIIDPLTGEVKNQKGIADFADKFMRHIVVGGEVMPAKFLSLRLGYNYQRRQELKVYEKPATVGISYGLSLKISNFEISYARSAYHLTGSPNFFTLTTNLGGFHKSSK
ncbi:MAG: type IX secretion system protein PorQ [Bacteroidales bacterium]|nr:type IX secretion system protein PorQ [Lentimicrobiaceae bacterium]MDD5696245.1 type IX secretion system protein PorQ [Bacteroidales bacterium]